MKTLYEEDFHEWALRNAELVRSGRIEEADWENIAEELEGMALSQRRELFNRLVVLMTHLLKWQLQTSQNAEPYWSWRVTINKGEAEHRAAV